MTKTHSCASKEPEDYEFDEWYQKTYGNPNWSKHGRSSRYYELRKTWKASKKFYRDKEMKLRESGIFS